MADKTTEYKQGQKVRFTGERLGVLDPSAARPAFHPEIIVGSDDEGVYDRPDPLNDGGDWHLCKIAHEGRSYEVPVHTGQFEVIA